MSRNENSDLILVFNKTFPQCFFIGRKKKRILPFLFPLAKALEVAVYPIIGYSKSKQLS